MYVIASSSLTSHRYGLYYWYIDRGHIDKVLSTHTRLNNYQHRCISKYFYVSIRASASDRHYSTVVSITWVYHLHFSLYFASFPVMLYKQFMTIELFLRRDSD